MKRAIRWLPLALLALGTSGCHLWGLLVPPRATPSAAATPTVFRLPALSTVFPSPQPTLPAATATSLAPDGSLPLGKIVFTCQVFRDSQRNQICLMGADGSAQARMTWEDQVDHVFPSLAPDGLSFVYAANPTGRYQIYEMDLLGAQHLVLSLEGDALAPEISSDGARLVFTYKSDDRQTIWVANRDGSDPHPVENPDLGQGWDPSWSPDGSRILFASDRAGDVQLFIIGADGAGLTQITQLQDLRGRNAWSPDGLSLATYAGDSWTREVILMGTDGADPHPVTSGGNNLAPSFSPDGAWIAYTSYRDRYQDDNGCEIYIQRLADGTTQRLTDNDYCDWQPRWGR